MSEKFNQLSFDFGEKVSSSPPPVAPIKENRFVPITLETGLDKAEVRNTAMLTLRCLLSQNIKRCVAKDPASLKNRNRFMAALGAEIRFKKTNTPPLLLIQETLLRTTL